jgi:hypothetical protein
MNILGNPKKKKKKDLSEGKEEKLKGGGGIISFFSYLYAQFLNFLWPKISRFLINFFFGFFNLYKKDDSKGEDLSKKEEDLGKKEEAPVRLIKNKKEKKLKAPIIMPEGMEELASEVNFPLFSNIPIKLKKIPKKEEIWQNFSAADQIEMAGNVSKSMRELLNNAFLAEKGGKILVGEEDLEKIKHPHPTPPPPPPGRKFLKKN